jgi:hypothetical protein
MSKFANKVNFDSMISYKNKNNHDLCEMDEKKE